MRRITYREAVREAITTEMRRDKSIIMLGEDIGHHGGAFAVSKGLFDEFGPSRIIDTPISESSIVGAAIGSSITGLRPIAEIMYSDFTLVAMDQIVNQAAKIRYMFGGKAKLPLVIRTPGGGGRSNAAQHSQSLEVYFAHVPGLKVVMPSTAYDVKGLLISSIRDDNPIVFIEHKLIYLTEDSVPEEAYTLPLGVSDVKRRGNDITIVALSFMVQKALAAAAMLAGEGIDCEVIDPRTIRPLDIDPIIRSIKKTGSLLVIHEACTFGGFGGEIAAQVTHAAFDYLDAPVERLGALETPIPYNRKLEQYVIPDENKIAARVKQMLEPAETASFR